MKNKLFIISSVVLLFFACSKKSEDTLNNSQPGGADCDTANITYSTVAGIISSNCYTCHGAATNSGSNGIILEGYDNLKIKADNGQLIGVITHTEGYPAMPQGFPKLSDCNINKIRSWINNGTQNN